MILESAVLEVRWRTIRSASASPRYPEWRALLHHFYDPFPRVEHFGAGVVGSADCRLTR